MNNPDEERRDIGVHGPQSEIALVKEMWRRFRRAVAEFRMIEPGDRILVGFSGGKDSALLLRFLAALRDSGNPWRQQVGQQAGRGLAGRFELAALTIDAGYGKLDEPAMVLPRGELTAYCESLGVTHFWLEADIAPALFAQTSQKPCSLCAHLRRGTINTFARQRGFNKVAYAHHQNDAVETLLLSIIYAGNMQVFHPLTHLERTGLTVIRPLVYIAEEEIRRATGFFGYSPLRNPCPLDGRTERARVKTLLADLSSCNPHVERNIFAVWRTLVQSQFVAGHLTKTTNVLDSETN